MKESPINKSLMTKNNNNLLDKNLINLSDMPDFIYPEKDNKILELFSYLTEKINLPYFSIMIYILSITIIIKTLLNGKMKWKELRKKKGKE